MKQTMIDDDTQDELEGLLFRNQMLLVSIIKGAYSMGFLDDLCDWLQEKVGESLRDGGIEQDSYQYFIDCLVMTQIEQHLLNKQEATTDL